MIVIDQKSFSRADANGNPKIAWLKTIVGLSTDEKPTDVVGGSIFIETDHATGIEIYVYDEGSSAWIKQ